MVVAPGAGEQDCAKIVMEGVTADVYWAVQLAKQRLAFARLLLSADKSPVVDTPVDVMIYIAELVGRIGIALVGPDPARVIGNLLILGRYDTSTGVDGTPYSSASFARNTTHYNIGPFNCGFRSAAAESAARSGQPGDHVEVHLGNPAELVGDVTIELELMLDAIARFDAHTSVVLHVGRFQLPSVSLRDIVGSGRYHRVSVFLGANGQQQVRLDGAPITIAGERTTCLARDWTEGRQAGVTPCGVLLIGGHTCPASTRGVYQRADGRVRNLRVYR